MVRWRLTSTGSDLLGCSCALPPLAAWICECVFFPPCSSSPESWWYSMYIGPLAQLSHADWDASLYSSYFPAYGRYPSVLFLFMYLTKCFLNTVVQPACTIAIGILFHMPTILHVKNVPLRSPLNILSLSLKQSPLNIDTPTRRKYCNYLPYYVASSFYGCPSASCTSREQFQLIPSILVPQASIPSNILVYLFCILSCISPFCSYRVMTRTTHIIPRVT